MQATLTGRTGRLLATTGLTALLSVAPFFGAFAAVGDFAILAGTAVTCTDSTIDGDIGVWPGDAITQTNCTITGTAHANDPAAEQAYADFLAEYDRLAAIECDYVLSGDLSGLTLTDPGVYCVDAASTTTGGTLTLQGDSSDAWLFKIGTLGTGALTGTNFTVVLDGVDPCDVTWWVAEAATLTDSEFVGTIYAGMAITVTRGTYEGDAYAKAAITMTGADMIGCEGGTSPGHSHDACNQGVGNGPEECDPGNSNQGDPSNSNDEEGGTPGNPGRKGGNGK